MADGRLDPTPLATLDIYVGRSAPFLWMPASDDGSQEGTLYFQWFDRGSNRIKAFHPSRSGDARWQDMTPAGTNVTAFSISADGSTMALVQEIGSAWCRVRVCQDVYIWLVDGALKKKKKKN